MTRYRDPSVNYRSAYTPYRGFPDAYVGVDMSRQDQIQLKITDQNMNVYGELPGAILKKCSWALNDIGIAELDLSNIDPSASRVYFGERELQAVFNNTPGPEIWQGVFQDENDKPGLQSYSCESLA